MESMDIPGFRVRVLSNGYVALALQLIVLYLWVRDDYSVPGPLQVVSSGPRHLHPVDKGNIATFSQKVLSTHMGNPYPNHTGNYYYRNHTLYHIGTLDPGLGIPKVP